MIIGTTFIIFTHFHIVLLLCYFFTVVYDGCPKSFDAGIWWPKTRFGRPAAMNCPKGSVGVYFVHYNKNCDHYYHLVVLLIKS